MLFVVPGRCLRSSISAGEARQAHPSAPTHVPQSPLNKSPLTKGRHGGGGKGREEQKPITVQRLQPLHPEGVLVLSPGPTSGGASQPPNQGLKQLIRCRPDINWLQSAFSSIRDQQSV